MTHDHSGNIDMSFCNHELKKMPLYDLGTEELLKDETYLVAFLACWLCKFVLPNKKADCVRASVFKVAKLMTHGEKVPLVVLVFESIYHVLRDISTSANLRAFNILLHFFLSLFYVSIFTYILC